MAVENMRLRAVDSQGQEKTLLDKPRSSARGVKHFSADYTSAEVPITLLSGAARVVANHDFIFTFVHVRNDEVTARDYDFLDGAAGQFLFRVSVLPQSYVMLGPQQLGANLFANAAIYCSPSGAWANGSRVTIAGVCVNKEVGVE